MKHLLLLALACIAMQSPLAASKRFKQEVYAWIKEQAELAEQAKKENAAAEKIFNETSGGLSKQQRERLAEQAEALLLKTLLTFEVERMKKEKEAIEAAKNNNQSTTS